MTLLVAIPSVPEAEALAPAIPAAVETVVCGVGVVASALGVAAAIGEHTSGVLLVGLAGTRDEGIAAICDVVEGSLAVNEAVGAGFGDGFTALGAMGIPGVGAGSDRVEMARVGSIAPSTSHLELPRVPVGTVASASGSPEEAAAWRRVHPDVVAEEMEGWAVANACARVGVPLATLRAISNRAGDRDHARWDFAGAFAALRKVLAAVLEETPR